MTKAIILFVFCLSPIMCVAQYPDTSWIYKIQPASFHVYKQKKDIPKEFYELLNIESIKDVAGPHGNFNKGCVGPGKRKRFNWLAKDDSSHWVISISHGGRAYGTRYYFISSRGNHAGGIEVYFNYRGNNTNEFSFIEAATEIRKGDYRSSELTE